MTREEAIKIIESNCSCSGSKLREACAMFIPELAESDDEKIMKAILIYLDWLDGRKDCQPKGDYTIRDMIAYIEKQKQSFKQISDSVIWDSGLKTGIELGKEEQKSEQYDIDVLEKHITKDSISELAHTVIVRNGWEIVEKEQKPIECIEFDNEFEKQVSHLLASVLNGEWEYDEGFVKHAAQSLLGYAKQELKPGWWTATINGEPIPTENHSVDIPLAVWSEEDEKRIQRICGFLWKNRKGDTDTIYQIEKDADWLKNLPERFVLQPKQEWSEEDKRAIDDAIEAISAYSRGDIPYILPSELLKDAERLKSLRPQPKQEWNEEDETRLKVIKEELQRFIMFSNYGTPLSVDDIDWLGKLPERFNLQPKQEWSDDIIRKAVKEVGLTQHQIDWFKTNVFPPKQELSEEDIRKIRSEEYTNGFNDAAFGGKLKEWSVEDEDRIRQIERIAQAAGCTQKLQEEIHDWFKSIRLRQKDNKCISPKEGDIVVNKYGEISIFENWGHHPDGGSFNDDSYFFAKCTLNGDDYYDDFDCYSESDGLRYATPEEIRKIVPYLLKSSCPQSHCEPTEEQKYDGNMDEECIKLCDVLNSIPSIDTFESCCGHLRDRYSIWFFCNDIITISRLGRCVERNYSDGKWELLVDSTDTHPTGVFWLRSKVPFQSYDEMEESVNELCNGIQHWFNTEFDSYFNSDSSHWKPSKEQMKMLAMFVNLRCASRQEASVLESLYNDLQNHFNQ